MAFKVAVYQSTSFYGTALCKFFDEHNYLVLPHAFTRDDDACLSDLKESMPALVVVPGMFEDADSNAVLVRACAHLCIPVVYLSSHRVFDATELSGPAMEDALLEPVGDLAIALAAMESLYLSAPKSVVLRLPWVVDDSEELLAAVCSALLAKTEVLVSDQWSGCFVDVNDVVRVVFAFAQQITCGADNWGVFHLRSNDHCSEVEFVERIKRILEKAGCEALAETVVVPSAQRFISSCGWLGGVRCTNEFGIQLRSWRQGLKSKTIQWLSEQVDEGNVVLHPES